MTIRIATQNDFDCLAEIEKNCFKSFWKKEDLLSTVEHNTCLTLVAEDDGNTVGYCIFGYTVWDAELLRIGVIDKYRNKGIATKLLTNAMNELQLQDLEKCFLEVRKSNAHAIKLYENVGFRKIAVREKYYENTEDAIIMEYDF